MDTEPVGFTDVDTDAPPIGIIRTALYAAGTFLLMRHSHELGVMMWQWIYPHIQTGIDVTEGDGETTPTLATLTAYAARLGLNPPNSVRMGRRRGS